jgi:hypothetical protein
LHKENKIMMEINEKLLEYLYKATKRPNKYFIELIGVNQVGGFEVMLKIIESSNISKLEKNKDNKKVLKLQDIYNNYLKTKQ